MRELVHELTAIFEAGGLVMWALLGTSCAIWYLMVRWWWSLRCEWRAVGRLTRETEAAVRRDRSYRPSAAGRASIFAAAANRFLNAPCGSRERLEAELEAGRERVAEPSAYLLVLVRIAPLLGLLGTVYGMVSTFGVLTAAGTAEPQALSRGISCALLTTQAGLLIALPGFYGHEWLRRWEQRLGVEVRRLRTCVVQVRRGP